MNLRSLLIVCALAVVPVAQARDPLSVDVPELRVMPGSQAQWIGRRMAVNGVPTHMREFTSSRSPTEVLDWYEREWKQLTLAEVQRHRQMVGELLVCTFGEHYASLSVRPEGPGSAGVLTVSLRPEGRWVNKRTEFPLPPQSVVRSRIEALDAGRRSETVEAVTRNSFWFSREYLIDALVHRGWTVNALPRPPQLPEGAEVLQFQHRSEQAQVTLREAGGGLGAVTLLMVHWTKGDES